MKTPRPNARADLQAGPCPTAAPGTHDGLRGSGAQLFTVRVWCQAAQFRAVVRAAGDEQAHLFTAAAPLAAFLLDAAADGQASGKTARPEARTPQA